MCLIVYIDNILILAESKELACHHVIGLLYLLVILGFASKPNCVLKPMEFLGFLVNSVQQELNLPAGRSRLGPRTF